MADINPGKSEIEAEAERERERETAKMADSERKGDSDVFSGSQKEPHSSGQDTMAGIAEIASSSTMSSSKTPLTGISSSVSS